MIYRNFLLKEKLKVIISYRRQTPHCWSSLCVSLSSNFLIGCQAETKFVKTEKSPSTPIAPSGSANRQTLFSWRCDEYSAHKMPFSGHIIKKFRKPTILKLNIEGLTANKMAVLQHLVILQHLSGVAGGTC